MLGGNVSEVEPLNEKWIDRVETTNDQEEWTTLTVVLVGSDRSHYVRGAGFYASYILSEVIDSASQEEMHRAIIRLVSRSSIESGSLIDIISVVLKSLGATVAFDCIYWKEVMEAWPVADFARRNPWMGDQHQEDFDTPSLTLLSNARIFDVVILSIC
ncbi:Muconate cycloisomerase [Anopheles sinensis]|uniref:Muconate cycloisomerase n=1 Tax=Anopheles sinensis TaxID=74873 RepID=A0A084VA55_ANOSI|nr:Muconate cycloisomerase [Anopheles sinensis]